MNKLLSLAMAGAAVAVLSLPADAKPGGRGGGGGGGRGGGHGGGGMARASVQARGQVAQAPRASMPRASAGFQNRAAINQRAMIAPRNQTIARERAGVANQRTVDRTNRGIRRNQPSVAFGGQNRRDFNRSDVRRDFRDRDFNRGDRFRRPPNTTWRHWDRDRIYSWDNHRWHWFNGAWVIVGASPYVSYYDYDYDEPYATAYVGASGSTVAAVQRQLANDGYNPGPVDGVLGGQTRSAVAAFQRDNGLAVTGSIDGPTLDEMGLR